MKDQCKDILEQTLSPYGLDIIKPFNVGDYNKVAKTHDKLSPLPQFERENALAFLVGNTKALWHPFVKRFEDDITINRAADPLDKYVEMAIYKAVSALPMASDIWFGFHGNENFVSLLHAAELCGLAQISPAHLAVSEDFGFWFGLRAVIIVDCDARIDIKPTNPCQDCHTPCLTKYQLAKTADQITRVKKWIAVRKSCPVGKDYQYSDNQLLYHHSKDPGYITTKHDI